MMSNVMPVEEKIQVMDESLSPTWHKDVLRDRARSVAAGRDKFIDWETAKQQINKAIK